MIAIRYNGEYFDLSDGEKITVEITSTVFNDESELLGSYTYPVGAPFSPKNNRLLNNAHLIENRSSRISPEVVLEVFGRPYKKCVLNFDVTLAGYTFNLAIDNAIFASLLKNTSLLDMFSVYENGTFQNFATQTFGLNKAETLAMMADTNQNPGKGPCVFFPYKNEKAIGDFSGEAPQLYADDIVYFNAYHGSFDAPEDMADFRKKLFYTPFFYLRWLLSHVCTYLGYEALGELFNDPRTLSAVIDNNGLLSYDEVFSDNGCRITIAQHLPAFKLNDFIKALRSNFKLAIYFDATTKKAYFNYAAGILSSPYAVDISGQTEPGYEITAYTPIGYELVQQTDDQDELFTKLAYVKSFFIGDQTDPAELDGVSSTVFSTDVTEPRPDTAATWRVPYKRILANGYTPLLAGSGCYNDTAATPPETGKNDFKLRLLTYRGMQPDSSGQLYPYASGDDLDSDGTYRAGLLSFWLGGERGMIASYLRDWLLYYLRTEQIQLSAYLTGAKLEELSPLQKLSWRTETQVLMTALFSAMSFETSEINAGRLAAKLTVYPVYNMVAADDALYTKVQAGATANIGVALNPPEIYVRLRTVESAPIRSSIGFITARFAKAYLDFFSDEAGTQPVSVQNLKVKLDWHFRGKPKGNIDQVNSYLATGTSYQIAPGIGQNNTDQIYSYVNVNAYFQISYSLTINGDGTKKLADYTVIS